MLVSAAIGGGAHSDGCPEEGGSAHQTSFVVLFTRGARRSFLPPRRDFQKSKSPLSSASVSAPALLERRKKHQTRRMGPPAPLPRGRRRTRGRLGKERFNALRRRAEALPTRLLPTPVPSDLLSTLRPGNRGEVAKRKAFEWQLAPLPHPAALAKAQAQLSYGSAGCQRH